MFGACLAALLLTQSAAAETLTIIVGNITQAEGSVMVAVAAGKEGFANVNEPAAAMTEPARLGEITFVATDLPPGEYAIRVMHDVNGNGELDTNFMGMPIEPWAMSNNAKGRFGPPKWKAVKFDLQGDTTQQIDLSD
jgi:uncharacterized protein (DUF2141 family)